MGRGHLDPFDLTIRSLTGSCKVTGIRATDTLLSLKEKIGPRPYLPPGPFRAGSDCDAPGAELGGTKPEHMRLRHEADKGRVLQQPDTEMLAACGIVAGASLLLA